MKYLVLFRGINVGGKNKVAMSELRQLLDDLGFTNVTSFINSGNVIFESSLSAKAVRQKIQDILPKHFSLNREILNILVLTDKQLQQVIDEAPKDFQTDSDKYYRDAIFLIDLTPEQAIKVFSPREGVDKIWQGSLVVYSQRLGAERTKSRLSKIISTPEYESMTIRSWGTTTKLAKLISQE